MPPIQDCVLRCRIRVKLGDQIFWDRHEVISRGDFAEVVLEWRILPGSSGGGRVPRKVIRIPFEEFLPVPDPTSDHELVSPAILDLDGATFGLIQDAPGGRFCADVV